MSVVVIWYPTTYFFFRFHTLFQCALLHISYIQHFVFIEIFFNSFCNLLWSGAHGFYFHSCIHSRSSHSEKKKKTFLRRDTFPRKQRRLNLKKKKKFGFSLKKRSLSSFTRNAFVARAVKETFFF